MRIIALVALVTQSGEIPAGTETEITDTAEAQRLIDIGAAKAVPDPEPEPEKEPAKPRRK